MEAEIIKLAASQGLWAVLFVGLLFYVLKENGEREKRLLSALEQLSEQYKELTLDLKEVRNDVKEVCEDLSEIKRRVNL